MCVIEFRKNCEKYKFYHFSTPKDYDKGIDYNGNEVTKSKYSKYGIMKNTSGLPTDWQGYGLI